MRRWVINDVIIFPAILCDDFPELRGATYTKFGEDI